MADSMLMPTGDQDFIALSMAKPMADLKGEERAKRLKALSIAAESEAGQSVRPLYFEPFFFPRTPQDAHPYSFADCARHAAIVFTSGVARWRAQNAAADARLEHARGRGLPGAHDAKP